MKRKLRMGMIGGGKGAFIGAVHRIALSMDGLIEMRCGALSNDPEKALDSGRMLFLPEDRIYKTYQEMIVQESKLPPDERIDFISIVTPNSVHFEQAMMALDHGFHVMIEKPMTVSLAEARLLQQKVKDTGLLLCLAHTYSGYPMVKQARQMIKEGVLGKIRKVWVEYPQGWLSTAAEKEGNTQAEWRTDPSRSGKSSCMGDIGTHAAHLAEYVSGLQITHVCAHLNTFVEGRLLEDDGDVLLKFNNGAAGTLMASQVAAGEENGIKFRIYGEKGGMEWFQQEPNTLFVKWLNHPTEILRTGVKYEEALSSYAGHNTRTPFGHPEGYLEAFGNIYRNFALSLSAWMEGKKGSPEAEDYPRVADGVRGMAFIETVLASAESDVKWTAFTTENI